MFRTRASRHKGRRRARDRWPPRVPFNSEKSLGRPLARNKSPIALVEIAGDERGAVGVGASDEQRRHAHHVGREARCRQRPQKLRGRDEYLAPHVAAFLFAGQLILEVHTGRPASIIPFISSKAFSGPPKPASASATICRK
jgi:hypothetical protein